MMSPPRRAPALRDATPPQARRLIFQQRASVELTARSLDVGLGMKVLRCAFVLLATFALSVSFGVPAEDVPETAYDESEALPYEGAPLFSIAVLPLSTRTTQTVPNSLHQKVGVPSRFPSARIRDNEAKGATDTRISLALLCTLLC